MTASGADYLRWAMFNGTVVEAATLRVSPLGPGFMFGEGLFETVRVRDSHPVFLADHHARLAASLAILGAPPASGHDEMHARCLQVIAANSLSDGNLKIVVFRDTSGWSELILAREGSYGPEIYTRGFRLLTVTGGLHNEPRPAMKSLNYLGNIRAKRAALAAGYDEAVFVDAHGHVLEGATTNVFVVRDRVVWTPPLSRGILPGVMRARVIGLLEPSDLREGDLSLADLLEADEIFVTNALLGIMPVSQVDQTAYDLSGNPVTRSLLGRLR
jgi:branched-subunit amino acid aminotransferase/4-amino-4-deoxychorismate lyase